MWLDADQAALRNVIERNAAGDPDRVAVSFQSGERWTNADVRDEAYRAANVLADVGIRQGDRVAIVLPNGVDFVRGWWGAQCLGAAVMPMNPALKGRMLSWPLSLAEPGIVVSTTEHVASRPELARRRTIDASLLVEGGSDEPPLRRGIALDDPDIILMTSGTTGPSKVWSSTVAQASTTGAYVRDAGLDEDDRFLIDLPLFHTAGLGVTTACLRSGTVAVIRERPTLSKYFDIARRLEVTAGFLVGSMAAKLLATPASHGDRDHRVRVMVASPLPPDLPRFVERFGIERVLTSYGSTETGGPIGSGANDGLPAPGSAGRERPGWGEYALVDHAGREVPTGEVGELLLRPAHPAATGGHYVADPDATAAAWAGGWFHTGDLFRRDEDGDYFFVERARDSIRRRGENISSHEVEREVLLEPGVAAAACIGVEAGAEVGTADDVGTEVKVFVVPDPGAGTIDFPSMARSLAERMPGYMVPRYYELIEQLPMTPTQRVQKHVLRARGNGPDTWDRARARPAYSREELIR